MNDATGFGAGDDLYRRWQALRQERPHLRARDGARLLGVSEAELVASSVGSDSVRLRPDWRELLTALGDLGPIMALTRNEHCVHERQGLYREVSVAQNGAMGLVVSADIDLRLFLTGWASAFAVSDGCSRSIQVFDHQGVAVHKVYLTERSDRAAWAAVVERLRASEQQAPLSLQPMPEAKAVRADAEVDVAALRSDWAQLQDTHHFFAMLKRHQLARTQALRLAGREWAEALPVDDLPRLLETAATHRVPLMVFVGNPHCIQIHTGTISTLRWQDDWFNVLDETFNLHLRMSGVQALWRVRKPSIDGVITAWEAFDAQGELVVQLFGARKPGACERDDWRELAESFAALER